MKRYILTISVIILIIGGGILWWKTSNENKKQAQSTDNTSKYYAERSSINQNATNNNIDNTNNTNEINTIEKENANNANLNNSTNPSEPSTKETEIAQFSTKIYNKDSKRQNNITITCKALTEKEIQPGETFSFCSIVGTATSSKGYQEEAIYVDGEKK